MTFIIDYFYDLYKSLMKRPLLPCAILGTVLITVLYKNKDAVLFVAIVLIFVAVLLILCHCDFKKIVIAVLLVLQSVSLLGVFDDLSKVDSALWQELEITAVVNEEPSYAYNNGSVEISVIENDTIPNRTKLRLTFDAYKRLKAGDKVRISVMLNNFSNDETELYYYSNGVYADAKLLSDIEILGKDMAVTQLHSIRKYINDTLYSRLSFPAASTLSAIMLGDKSSLSDEFYADVKTVGVSHIMAVSGLHLSIIMGWVFKILDNLFYNKYFRFVLSVVSVLFIVSLCGFTRSVIRAALMLVISVCAPLLNRENDSLSSLCAAVLLIIAVSPLAIFDCGFQLSVMATFGVIVPAPYYAEFIKSKFKKPRPILGGIVDAIAVSYFAGLMTLPIVILEFGYISLASIFANLLITYAVMGALIFSVLGVVLCWSEIFNFITMPFIFFAGYCAEYINGVIKMLADIPFAAITLQTDTQINIAFHIANIIIFAFLIAMYTCKRRKNMIELSKAIYGNGG